jgi:hypothetical protein
MTKSSSKADDERREADGQSAVTKKHGGVIVESIAPEDLESFNDADCKHEKIRQVANPDGDYLTYECVNPRCNEIFLYDKGK